MTRYPLPNGFTVGDRVKFSQYGLTRLGNNNRNNKIGTVIGSSRDSKCLNVRWDGHKQGGAIYVNFIEKHNQPIECQPTT